jgi:hypothetical protein
MTFGEMQDRTRTRLNELTSAFFSDDDIQTSLNEGYAELADATEFYEREAMVPLLKWRTYYDLSLILPDTFLSPRRAYNPRTSRWMIPTDDREMDFHTFVQWELTKGEPEKYLMRGNWWLGVFPKPDRDSEGLRLIYSAIPSDMTDDDEEPVDIPREFHQGIMYYAISDLMSQQRETVKAIRFWGAPDINGNYPANTYKGVETKLKAYVDGRTKLAEARTL